MTHSLWAESLFFHEIFWTFFSEWHVLSAFQTSYVLFLYCHWVRFARSCFAFFVWETSVCYGWSFQFHSDVSKWLFKSSCFFNKSNKFRYMILLVWLVAIIGTICYTAVGWLTPFWHWTSSILRLLCEINEIKFLCKNLSFMFIVWN